MFWGLIIEPHKRYAQTVVNSFHVSMASLETNTTVDGPNEVASVMLEFEHQEYILCNLHKQKALQSQLDLNFKSGDTIAFFSSGKSRVHLTGYLIETEEEDDDDEDTPFDYDIDASDDDAEISSKLKPNMLITKPAIKRKKEPQTPVDIKKKAKVEPESEEENSDDNMFEDSEDDEDDDDDDGIDEEEIVLEDSDDDGDEIEEESSKKIELKNKSKQGILTPKNKTPVETKDQRRKKSKTPNEKQLATTPKTPAEANGPSTNSSTKKTKKKPIQSPAADTPKAGQIPANTTPSQSKTLQGGVGIEDIKMGTGPVAKAGKRVTVYYIGRLKSNNKQFDATIQGPGFKFHLGRGEVIKGWDIGVAGMRVGGKRKIVCPPGMAYGDKGSPPVIPPHSTLVFEVELKGVN